MSSLVSDKISTISAKTPITQAKSAPLRQSVREFLRQYFIQCENMTPTNVYEAMLIEIEIPLLEMVLQYTRQNQSKAAHILAMSRGTLRKKMKQCGLLPPQGKKIKLTKHN